MKFVRQLEGRMKDRGTILITGGAGYIGSHAVLAMRDAGFPIAVIDNLSTGRRELVPDDIPFIEGSIGDPIALRRSIRLFRPHAVMHFAGTTIIPESIANPLKYYRENTTASQTLISLCIEEGIRNFVFSSSAAVYGCPDTTPVPEDAATRPITPYGSSKLMTEWMLRDVAAVSDFRYATLRYFNVAGADPAGRSGHCGGMSNHLIKVACEAATGRRPDIPLYGEDYDTPDGTCIRDFMHVSDLASAHIKALDHLVRHGTNLTLNCGYGHGVSVREIVEKFGELLGHPLAVRTTSRRPGDVPVVIADTRRIRTALDWSPQFDDLNTIIGTALDWERRLAVAEREISA